MAPGWRRLGIFWLTILLLLASGGVTLQMLGPPPVAPTATHVVALRQQPPVPPTETQGVAQPSAGPASQPDAGVAPALRPGRDTPGPIADPDPALLEPADGEGAGQLPRIATDGRMPMQVYAAGFDRSSRRARVGLVLAGVGLNAADSEAAIRALPGGITLAFSPYASNPTKLLAAARLAEHEYLLSIPMEPQGFPLNDPGPHALMTNLTPEQNLERLDWALSRIAGYVGATGALGGQRGERLAGVADQMTPVLKVLSERGLLYIDPRPGEPAPPAVWGRSVDLVIDEPPDAARIDDRLAQLARIAHDKGSALGLAGMVSPTTTARITAWASGLLADGLALAPVSALVLPPQGVGAK
jgi:polysaccharide deacetylase 2 family uncharacterized protein YibQ